jgi:hypothetical protein
MKPFLLASAAILLVVFTACKKSSNSSSTPSGTLTATISGTSFKGTVFSNTYDTSLTAYIFNGASLAAGDSTILTVGFPDTTQVGIPLVIDGTMIYLSYYNSNTQVFYVQPGDGTTGTFLLTSLNATTHTAVGTFSGVTLYNSTNNQDSVVVTNGKFNLSYEVQ